MNDAGRDDRAAVRQAILRHLSEHPRASDTATGICSWWLASQGLMSRPRTVEKALEALVAEGLIRRVRLPDGSLIYGGAGLD